MTAIGPAGLSLIVFVGAIGALTTAYSIELAVRRALGLDAAR